MKRNWIRLGLLFLALVLLAVGISFIFVHECDSIAGMGQSVVACECAGTEWLLYDRTEADGPRRSLCLGFVTQQECFEFIDGPRVDCDALIAR